jgi:hypothetical protein
MPSKEYNLSTPQDRTTVLCLFCNQQNEVGQRAMSITCRHCHKPLRLEDIRIKEYQARRQIDTCGTVVIEKKGNVISDRILCGAMVVRGKVKGQISSRGPVLISPEAEVTGDVTAPALAVGAGAILEGEYRIGP